MGAATAAWLLVDGALTRHRDERARRLRRTALIAGRRASGGPDGAAPASPGEGDGDRSDALPGGASRARTLRRPRFAATEDWLRHAGIAAGAGPFVLLLLTLTGGGAALGAGAGGLVGGLCGAVAAPAGLMLLTAQRRKSRRSRMNGQLPDLLQVLAGALVAGQSFLQALDQTTDEVPEPLRAELVIALAEVELGASLEEALEHLQARVLDDDLDLVVDAVLIQRRVGGNLAEILQNIGWTIRERIRIRGEVRSLTGQARMSSWVLGGLPVVMAGGLTLINPAYMAPLLETPLGHVLIGAAVCSEVVGMLLMRRIANVRV